jgi:hypothetical protein
MFWPYIIFVKEYDSADAVRRHALPARCPRDSRNYLGRDAAGFGVRFGWRRSARSCR